MKLYRACLITITAMIVMGLGSCEKNITGDSKTITGDSKTITGDSKTENQTDQENVKE